MVRTSSYLRTREKVPAAFSVYTCVAVDHIASDERVANVAGRVAFAESMFEDGGGGERFAVPEVFVCNVQVSSVMPSVLFPAADGRGHNIVSYYTLSPRARSILRAMESGGTVQEGDEDARGALTLWRKWCERAEGEAEWRGRFKLIAQSDDLAAAGFPAIFLGYNGKPVLIRRAGTVDRGEATVLREEDGGGGSAGASQPPTVSYISFSINLHSFPYLAKSALLLLLNSFIPRLQLDLAFVVEGREEEELPEALVGAVRLGRPSVGQAVEGEDFFGEGRRGGVGQPGEN